MNMEKRTLVAGILGVFAFLAVCAATGYIIIKYYHLLNAMIALTITGALFILAGMLCFMIVRSSYMPAVLILAGLAQQGLILFIYLKIKLAWGAAAVCGLIILMFLIYLLDPLDIYEHQAEDKFESMERDPNIISFAEKAGEIRKEKESKRTVTGAENKEVS